MTFRRWLALIAAIVLAAFVLFNLEPARVWFFVGRVEMPIGVLVLVSAALGAAVVWSWGVLRRPGDRSKSI